MSDSPILTPEEVRSERYRYPDSTTEDGANDVIALGDSHEALREERDELARTLSLVRAALVAADAQVRTLREALTDCVDTWVRLHGNPEPVAIQNARAALSGGTDDR